MTIRIDNTYKFAGFLIRFVDLFFIIQMKINTMPYNIIQNKEEL